MFPTHQTKMRDLTPTEVVLRWLWQHPDLADDVRNGPRADVRATVTSFLYPYDRFPQVLDALLKAALENVDWESVSNQVGGKT